jgi:1-deoxy-D-xylulose-5-phosphate reductoisomerase
MNKGFEVIEGSHLFDVPIDNIDVVIHPQSTVHSMVEYVDGSVIAQLGVTDMYFPIQHVLLYPKRLENKFPRLDLVSQGALTFEKPDHDAFPCLRFAYEAVRRGGSFPAVLNAANEVAVSRFIAGEIPFLGIPELVRGALDAWEREAPDLRSTAASHRNVLAELGFEDTDDACAGIHELAEIHAADQWARRRTGIC